MCAQHLEEMTPARILANLGRILATRPLTRPEVEAVAATIEETGAADVVDAIDNLVSEGIEEAGLKTAVSRLLNLVSRPLSRVLFEPKDPLFQSLVLENKAFLSRLEALRPLVARIAAQPSQAVFDTLRLSLEDLGAVDIHYVKKENILFPYFEARYPRYRCLSLMWSLHDDVRSSLSKLLALIGAKSVDAKAAAVLLGRFFFDAHSLVFREEKLLFPLMASLLSLAECSSLYFETKALGFCFLGAEIATALDLAAGTPPPLIGRPGWAGVSTPSHELDSGTLDPLLVDLILKSLPVDITFVDAEDRVAYFSNTKQRVFPRSPAIIGRDVRNCHPVKSLGKVLGIIEAFRKGEGEVEEFWLETGGRFVRIEYRAIRNAAGEYLGTLEIGQDLSALRALEGEKLLPD